MEVQGPDTDPQQTLRFIVGLVANKGEEVVQRQGCLWPLDQRSVTGACRQVVVAACAVRFDPVKEHAYLGVGLDCHGDVRSPHRGVGAVKVTRYRLIQELDKGGRRASNREVVAHRLRRSPVRSK